MKVVDSRIIEVIFYVPDNGNSIEQQLEVAGRTCYKSGDRITNDSADAFIRALRKRGHHAMLEFGYVVVRIIADRGFLAEITRHRICSFAVESTRYCNYSKDKFGNEITVVKQLGIKEGSDEYCVWLDAMYSAEKAYFELLNQGMSPQIARAVLPNALATEIVIGANLREWRHIFDLRCSKEAHPAIRLIMLQLLQQFYNRIPVLYEDLAEKYNLI